VDGVCQFLSNSRTTRSSDHYNQQGKDDIKDKNMVQVTIDCVNNAPAASHQFHLSETTFSSEFKLIVL